MYFFKFVIVVGQFYFLSGNLCHRLCPGVPEVDWMYCNFNVISSHTFATYILAVVCVDFYHVLVAFVISRLAWITVGLGLTNY